MSEKLMENLIFIDDQQEEVTKWVDSPIPLFIAQFKRSIRYKGEYGFSWYERGDYLFNYHMLPGNIESWSEYRGDNDFISAHYEKDRHSSISRLKNEYTFRRDLKSDSEYCIPIITFYPEIKSLSLDVLLHFSTLPAGSKKKEEKVYWETFNNTKFLLKSSDKNIVFENPEIFLGRYSEPELFFEGYLHNNDIRARHLNTTDGVLYIPDLKINISGKISADTEIWIEDIDGKIVGTAEIKSNNKILELPIQFVIPYRKDRKEIETNAVLLKIGDIDNLLNDMNNLLFSQSLVKFKPINASQKIQYLELRPFTDYITNEDSGELFSADQQEFKEKQAFSQAITLDLGCSLKYTNAYLKSEAKKMNIRNDVFIVFLTPYRYYYDKIGAGGSSPVYDRSGVLIIEASLNSYKIIGHELGHAMGLLHMDENKESDYTNKINSAESQLSRYKQFVNNFNQLSAQPTALPNETDIAFQRRYYNELSLKSNLSEMEIQIKMNCEKNIDYYDRALVNISQYEDRIEKLKIASDIDKYTINDLDNMMYHDSSGREDYATIQPWQTRVIQKLNS